MLRRGFTRASLSLAAIHKAPRPGANVGAAKTGNARGALHSHPHIQSTYVARGRFRFFLGDDSVELAPGDSLVIPSGMRHGCECLEAGELIDNFTPRRDDFL